MIIRSSVQGLICLLTKNNVAATEQLNTLLYNKMNSALQGSDQVSSIIILYLCYDQRFGSIHFT